MTLSWTDIARKIDASIKFFTTKRQIGVNLKMSSTEIYYGGYTELLDLVKKTMVYKGGYYEGVTAVYADSEEKYNMAKKLWKFANSYRGSELPIIWGEYAGPDWYIIRSKEYDDGKENYKEYWVESLTDEKRRFEKYCLEFNDILREQSANCE